MFTRGRRWWNCQICVRNVYWWICSCWGWRLTQSPFQVSFSRSWTFLCVLCESDTVATWNFMGLAGISGTLYTSYTGVNRHGQFSIVTFVLTNSWNTMQHFSPTRIYSWKREWEKWNLWTNFHAYFTCFIRYFLLGPNRSFLLKT